MGLEARTPAEGTCRLAMTRGRWPGVHDVGVITQDGAADGTGGAAVRGGTLGLRLAVAVPLAVVGIPLLALYLYLLWWWLPALAGPGAEPCDPAVDGWGVCWRPEQRALWIAAAAVGLPGAGCLLMSLVRLRRAGRWWPWPVATVVLFAAGLRMLTQIP
jgi:hypothetical protein